jgi:parallel beta-helix repeat protein
MHRSFLTASLAILTSALGCSSSKTTTTSSSSTAGSGGTTTTSGTAGASSTTTGTGATTTTGTGATTTTGTGGATTASSSGTGTTTTSTGTTTTTGTGGLDAGITGLTGTTYYVSASTGSDTNPGTSAAPWKTIQHAGAVVAAGDTVLVRAGTYDGPIFGWDTPPCADDDLCVVAGTAAHPILFEADPAAAAGAVVIAGKNAHNKSGFDLEPGCDYVDIVGFTVTNGGTADNAAGSITKAGIAVSGCTGNRIVGNTVNGVTGIGGILVDTATNVIVQGNTLLNTQGTGTTGHGMYVSGSSVGVQVLGNVLHDNAYVGIHVNGDVSEGLPGVVKGLLIAGNLIYKNGQNGINADGIESSTIENNVIYGNARNGIELYQIDAYGGSTGNVIVNNTIDQSMVAGGYAISIAACQYDNQGSQPTPAGCAAATADTSTGNIAFDNVLLGGAGATGTVSSADLATSTNLTTAAANLFVNSAAGNYQLAAGGPGVGKGIGTFGGASAPAAGPAMYDIGAFAFVP